MNELLTGLAQSGLVDGSLIILERTENGSSVQIIEIVDFERMFGSALAEEDAYPALLAADDNGDGTTKGYKRFFDAWRAAGII